MSGNNKITACQTHEKTSEIYDTQFTPLLLTNPLPVIDDDTDAFWGRLILIPFRRNFRAEGLDKSLKEDLAKEKSGILNWLVKGAKDFYADNKSLPACSVVTDAIASYRAKEDALERFIQEECVINANVKCRVGQLRDRFNCDRGPFEQWGFTYFKQKNG